MFTLSCARLAKGRTKLKSLVILFLEGKFGYYLVPSL